MIPKIIHYTWFSGEPFPPKVQECIDSWHKYLPEYELRLWNMEAIKGIDSVFLHEALNSRKWAFASDFVRLWAVYHEGGIYLDTDVLLYQSFDKFLHDRAFIGSERTYHFDDIIAYKVLGSHCFGAEKGHPFIKTCLDYYDGRHFITSKNENLPPALRFNQILQPVIQAEIARTYGFDWSVRESEETQVCDSGLMIYPGEYFDTTPWANHSAKSVCAHLALGSWRDKTPIKSEKLTFRQRFFWRFILPYLHKYLRKYGYYIFRK